MRPLLGLLLAAQIYAADPRLGEWKLISVEAITPLLMSFKQEGASIHYSYFTGTEFSAQLDGQVSGATGTRNYDKVSLSLVDPNTISAVWMKNGKSVATIRYHVSDSNPNRLEMNVRSAMQVPEQIFKRRGTTFDTTNKVLGDWLMDPLWWGHQDGDVQRYTAEGPNSVRSETLPTKVTYIATLDGMDSKSLRNDPFEDSVAVQVLDRNTVQEVFKKNGQTLSTFRFIISNGGNTMTMDSNDRTGPHELKLRYTYRKQH